MDRKLHFGLWSLTLTLAAVMVAPAARADEWNKLTDFTFNRPVEVPGHVLLPGTYVFKLLDSPSNRDIVEIYDGTQQHLITTILAIPDYRLRTPGKPIINFEERKAGAPEAVRSWYYPGDNYGWQFVYNKPATTMMASAAMPASTQVAPHNVAPAPAPAVNATAPAPAPAVQAQQPQVQQQTEIAMAQVPVEAQHAAPTQLPKTASPLFGLFLTGLALTGSGAALNRSLSRG
jgi:hypothetical protein